jgi:hypothetical protein
MEELYAEGRIKVGEPYHKKGEVLRNGANFALCSQLISTSPGEKALAVNR